jgi:LytS/YehU family sensor histidine kinase
VSILFAVLHQGVFATLVIKLPVFRGAMPSPVEIQMSLVVYWIVVAVAHGVRYYVGAARLQAQLAGARLDLLRSQLQPHFLFNALNDIAELMYEDTERADLMLTSLSDLLRSSLRDPAAREVALGDEIAFLRRYLDIVKMRWQDRLRVDVDVPPELAHFAVPSLILQPLVENAVRHGIGSRGGPLIVQISATRVGDKLRLTVSDNGTGLRDATTAPGIGLRNTRERLQEHFGDDFRLELLEVDGGGVRAIVEIPTHTPAPVPALAS